jgi:hypothetical protein
LDIRLWAPAIKLKKFRCKEFDELSNDTKKPKEWKEALKLCLDYEKGEYKPEFPSDSDQDESSAVRKTARVKQDSSSKLTTKRPTSEAGTPRGRPRKTPKFTKVPLKDIAVDEIVEKLQNPATSEPEILTLLDILSKIDVPLKTLRVRN